MDYQQKNSEFSLSPAEIRRVVDGCSDLRDKLILSFMAFLGMRRAEVRNLEWDDIDLELGRLQIRNGKGGKLRLLFLAPEMMQLLREYHGNMICQGYLFPGRNAGPITLRTINNIVARAGKRSRIRNPNPRYPNLNPHLFRHSLARNWKREGGSIETLQKILGHSSVKTTLDLYGTESLQDVENNFHEMLKRLF